ncbi:MAG: cytochrome c551/c552 [Halioglobus sp.]
MDIDDGLLNLHLSQLLERADMKKVMTLVLMLSTIAIVSPSRSQVNEIELPKDVSKLRPSPLPGYDIALQKCGICHSANYVSYQPPGKDQRQWTAEMKKMQHSYGAPLSEDEIKLIGAYLSVEYGSASATDESVVSLSTAYALEATAVGQDDIDVNALLSANACLGCHAIETDVVGPSFVKIAESYKNDPNAQSKISASIRKGGSGKWGAMAMPPMSGLKEREAQALAVFVLNTAR